MEIITIKILGGILLFICMVVFGLLPIFNKSFKTNSRLLSFCNCFCGGLFLAIGLVHILPEAHDMLDEMPMECKLKGGEDVVGCGEDGLQWSYLICLMSFSAILLLDKVIFNNSDIADHNEHNEMGQKTNLKTSILNSSIKESLIEDSDTLEENFKERVSSKYKIALRLSRNSNLQEHENKIDEFLEHDKLLQKPKLKIVKSKTENNESGDDSDKKDKSSEILNEPLLTESENLSEKELLEIQNQKNKVRLQKSIKKSKPHNQIQVNVIDVENQKKNILEENLVEPEHFHHEGHQHQNLVGKDDSILTSIILLVAMGIHGFFSLLAFGIEPTKAGTINLFIALIIHKWSEALTVGNQTFLLFFK
jgi:zinc transporter 1/2/3